jgi:glutaredoxin
MKAIILTALAALLAAGPLCAAQLYRWVDEKGNVEWRDTPPPSTAKKVEQRTLGRGNTIETSSLPYSVQQAIKKHPVTLWTFDCGEPCTDARNHLTRRGIPYTERNSQKDPEGLKKATGGTQVPVLIVGTTQHKGYLESTWDAALDAAGYPSAAIPGVKVKPAAKAPEPASKGAASAAPR